MADETRMQIIENLFAGREQGPANYKLATNFKPNGDQPKAIADLMDGVKNDERDQVEVSYPLSCKR